MISLLNIAIMVGQQKAGIRGAAFAALGAVLPPVVIMCIVSAAYDLMVQSAAVEAFFAAMRGGIAALVVSSAISMVRSLVMAQRWRDILVVAISFLALFFVSSTWVFILCVLCGAVELAVMKCRS